jgi:hypothetical protein
MEEYEKFQKAQEKANETQQSWQQQMRRFEEETQLELTENQSSAEAHLNTKAFEISKVSAAMCRRVLSSNNFKLNSFGIKVLSRPKSWTK